MITIVKRELIDEIQYNNLLRRSSPSFIYSELFFLDAIASYLECEVNFILRIDGDEITAALPFCVCYGEFGPVINSLPFFGSHGGVINLNKGLSDTKEIIDTLSRFSREIGCASLTLIESYLSKEPQEAFSDFQYRDSRIGLYNKLNSLMSREEILNSFETRARTSIRKALKSGLTFRESKSDNSIDFLATVHIEYMNSIGGKAKSKEFFTTFLDKLPRQNWVILEAYFEEKRVASLLLIYNSDVIEYFTPVALPEFKKFQPISLLVYAGFEFAIRENISLWNWGGTWMSQKGVYQFKKQWKPIEATYSYYCQVLNPLILETRQDAINLAYPYFYVYPFDSI
jgi:hypothetical protein